MIAPAVIVEGATGMVAALSLVVGLFAGRRARVLAAQAEGHARERYEAMQTAAALVEKALDGHAKRIAELEQQPVAASQAPRPGMNLTKRAQVLRMHRHGNPPDRIAAALELPQQEVELLIKVHRLVIASL